VATAQHLACQTFAMSKCSGVNQAGGTSTSTL
jgi:hypothetical protein